MFNEYFYPFCSWIYSFVLRDSGFNSEDECPPSIISCPYARMGCQTKVKKNKVVDVKSKVLHGCFQDRWNNQEVYESSSPYIYACNRILVTLSYIASRICSQSNNKYTPNREIPSTSWFFFSFFTCLVEGCCIKAANGKFPWFWASKTSRTEPLEINAKNRNSCSPDFQNFM